MTMLENLSDEYRQKLIESMDYCKERNVLVNFDLLIPLLGMWLGSPKAGTASFYTLLSPSYWLTTRSFSMHITTIVCKKLLQERVAGQSLINNLLYYKGWFKPC